MLNDLMTDLVTIHTTDRKIFKDVPASVQRNRIYTKRTEIPIRPGDRIIRRTTAGIEEIFIVDDPGFYKGKHGIPDTYQMHVHRADIITPTAASTVIYNITGTNARFNINSVDASTNVVNQSPTELFQALREAINAGVIDAAEKQQLQSRTRAMEQEFGKKGFARKYGEFMASAANHMEVFGPFFPALSQLLSGG